MNATPDRPPTAVDTAALLDAGLNRALAMTRWHSELACNAVGNSQATMLRQLHLTYAAVTDALAITVRQLIDDGWTWTEIGAVVGVSEDTARSAWGAAAAAVTP